MLLYALDKLFNVFDQVKRQPGMAERLIVAYDILCLSALQCTERWHGLEKGVPDALSLLNVNDTHHLECLTWAVYDGALLVGRRPELPGNHQWCTVLVGLYKHIYRGFNDTAHCPSYTLASWDCQERTEVLHREGKLGSAWSGQQRASRPRRRSRSSSRRHSRTLALRDWSGHSCCSPPNTLPRCHCRGPLSPGADTMPKLALAVNVPAYAHSSCSSGGRVRASLDDEDAWEDDFQTPPHASMHGDLAMERMEASEGSPGWQSFYRVNIGEEEPETLGCNDPHWTATHWLQVAVQGTAVEEVPWYELVTRLMSGVEGAALSLAKHLLSLAVEHQGVWGVRLPTRSDRPQYRSIHD